MPGPIDIPYTGLFLTAVFIVISGAVSIALHLGLERDLLWGSARMAAQLFVMGFVLRYVFAFEHWAPVLAFLALMMIFASHIIKGRVQEPTIPVFALSFFSMVGAYYLITFLLVRLIIGAEPWYSPRYFIPLGGMVIGNSMTAIAITLERLLNDLRQRKEEIELHLSLGANARQASADVFREAVKAGMIPAVNSMMGAGLVFLPGMMTGQIISGADPVTAIKYQIMVLLMLTGSTALGSVVVAWIVRNRCFSKDDRFVLPDKAPVMRKS